MRAVCLSIVMVLLSGCLGMPRDVEPVENFELERYLGHWYEIARLDHSFERGLSDVTATYTLRDDGGVAVLNRGYAVEDGEWRDAQGRAYFVDRDDVAHLKVSFFGPFFGSYVVFELDEIDYSYAFVSGPNTDFLWLLAREPSVEPAVLERFRERAAQLGFDTAELIYPEHGRAPAP